MKQASKQIMMVRPKHFGYDPDTAESNAFQQKDGAEHQNEIAVAAIKEFDEAVIKLRAHDIDVVVIDDTEQPVKPNAVFPNNWISFHDEKVLLYPMLAENRRWERREEILTELKTEEDYEVVDFSAYEEEGKYLESTGSIIFDYENQLAYACLSPRTDKDVLLAVCDVLKFEPVLFDAFDKNGQAIYHTNVLMCLGHEYAVICLDAIPEDQRKDVRKSLEQTGHKVVNITHEQMENFAGNMIELEDKNGNSVLTMSESAMKSLTIAQKEELSEFSKLLYVSIPTIEKYGGGSARCMMCRTL